MSKGQITNFNKKCDKRIQIFDILGSKYYKKYRQITENNKNIQ